MTRYDAIYGAVAKIPRGKVSTYGQIAFLAGMPRCSRLVGRALAQAPAYLPCHRVVNHAGRLAPSFQEQRELLQAEGIRFRPNGCVDLKQCLWHPFSGETP